MSSNSTKCNGVCWVQWCVYVPILVIGFPLNLAALWQLIFRVRRYSESTVYLANLMINDVLLMFSLPFKMHAYERTWNLGLPFCTFLESMLYVNIYGSIMLSVCISVDRYIGLQFPFAAVHLRSPRKASLACLVVWIVVFASSVPIYTLHETEQKNKTSRCFQEFTNGTWSKSWIVVSMETVFCSSAVVMVFCSVRVIQILQDLRKRNPDDPKLRTNKSVKIVLSNLVVFLVCFIPYHIAAPLYFKAKTDEMPFDYISRLRYFIHISMCISSMNCLADGACYYFILKENIESVQRERRMAIQCREARIRELNSCKKSRDSKFGDLCYSVSKHKETEICVDTGFT